MALTLKKDHVKRGRAEDNFAEAAASTEPAPSGRDMAVMSESIRTQLMLQQKLMTKQVYVALEEPYLGDPQRTVVLVYGREEATPVGDDRYQDDGAGSPPTVATERLFTQGAEFAAPRWEPGKWVHYHLRWEEGPLGKCECGQDPETIVGRACIMPAPVARHWFGDWDVVSYELRTRPGQMVEDWLKRSWHRDRVANECWGGYEWDFPPGVPVFDAKGAVNYRAMRRFGPPAVPHVVIHRLDSMMRKLPNTEARPWEIFDWVGACDKGPRVYFTGQSAPAKPGVMQVTEAEFKEQIALAVAAALAAERAAHPRKGSA
jgi:hypothetical protein